MDARRWHVVDCGDVDYIPGDLKGTMANLESAVSIIQKQGALPVVLGGDCAVDFPVLQGLEGIGNFDIVHIDAHLDWTKPLDGQKFFNGSPHEKCRWASLCGTNPPSGCPRHWQQRSR